MRLLLWMVFAGVVWAGGGILAAQERMPDPGGEKRKPELEQVLTAVQANYAQYLKTLPNLYAQESMFSDVTYSLVTVGVGGPQQEEHVAYESVYRLRRVADAVDAREMEETRQIVAVDHKPVGPGTRLVAPYLVIDSEYAPNVFWPGWGRCFDYKLGGRRRWQGRTVWVLQYATGKRAGLTDKCPLREPVEGRALIDPETMTMVRFEQTRGKHPPDQATIQKLGIKPEVTGVWRWSIDYAPVMLEGKSFELPAKITSTYELFGPRVLWSTEASYTKYQLADVHSKVLLPDGTEIEGK